MKSSTSHYDTAAWQAHDPERVADMEVGRFRAHTDAVLAAAFHPSSRLLATAACDGNVRVWSVGGARLAALRDEAPDLLEHTGPASEAFSGKRGKRRGMGARDPRQPFVRLVKIKAPHGGDAVQCLAFDGAGTLYSGARDGRVLAWVLRDESGDVVSTEVAMRADTGIPDVEAAKGVAVFRGHDSWVNGLAVSRDTRMLATGSSDKTVRLWSTDEEEDEATAAAAQAAELRVVSLGDEEEATRSSALPARSTAGRAAARHGRRCLAVLRGHSDRVYGVSFTPDGSLLASCGKDRNVLIWLTATGKCVKVLRGHEAPVLSVDWAPGGESLCSGAQDSTVRLWDASTLSQAHVLRGARGGVYCCAFSPDGGCIAAGARDYTVRVFDTSGAAIVGPAAHTGRDGAGETTEASSSVAWALTRTFRGFGAAVMALAFSADGRMLSLALEDGNVAMYGNLASLPQRANPAATVTAMSELSELRSRMAAVERRMKMIVARAEHGKASVSDQSDGENATETGVIAESSVTEVAHAAGGAGAVPQASLKALQVPTAAAPGIATAVARLLPENWASADGVGGKIRLLRQNQSAVLSALAPVLEALEASKQVSLSLAEQVARSNARNAELEREVREMRVELAAFKASAHAGASVSPARSIPASPPEPPVD